MTDIMTQPSPQADIEAEAKVNQLLAEMNHLESQMIRDRTESERLKFETQVIKAITEAKLTRLEEQVNNLARTN